MTDRDPVWDALKDHSKAKFNADRERFMAQAIEQDDGGAGARLIHKSD